MSSGHYRRYRPGKGGFIASRGTMSRILEALRRTDVLIRLGMCTLAAAVMWLLTGAWEPLFSFRPGHIPTRDLVARVDFRVPDPSATDKLRDEARRSSPPVFINSIEPLDQARRELSTKLSQVVIAESFEKVDKLKWKEFSSTSMGKPDEAVDRERFK